jgi:hypothetical protein
MGVKKMISEPENPSDPLQYADMWSQPQYHLYKLILQFNSHIFPYSCHRTRLPTPVAAPRPSGSPWPLSSLSLCTPSNILVFRTFKNTKLLKIFSNYRPNSLSFKYSKLINKCTLQLNPHLCWIWLLSDPLKILFGFEVEIPFQILLLKPRRRPLSLVLLFEIFYSTGLLPLHSCIAQPAPQPRSACIDPHNPHDPWSRGSYMWRPRFSVRKIRTPVPLR